MARDDDRVHPDIKRALGAADAHAGEAERLLAEPRAKRQKQPSLEDITEDITEEISSVIREELAKRPSDGAALSMAGPLGIHVSARGRVVWLLAVALVLLVGGIVLGRVTVPRAQHEAPAAPH